MILSKKVYSMDALRIAAQVLSAKVDVYVDEDKGAWDVTLKAKRRDADPRALEGEFGNELLNQEYRFVVGAFNRKISSLIVTKTLLAARGGDNPPPALPPEEREPAFQAKVAELMKSAQDEISRTMPRKLPHQGQPIPPEKEDAGV